MSRSVVGDIAVPMPAAMMTSPPTSRKYCGSTPMRDTISTPPATIHMPIATTRRLPKRAANFADCGAAIIIATEIGRSRTAASSGE